MNSRRKKQVISVLIRLIALLLCIIYFLLTYDNSVEEDTKVRNKSTVQSGEQRQSRVKEPNGLSKEQWATSRYIEQLEEIAKYNCYDSIRLIVDAIEIPKYITGKELKELGGESKIQNESIYPFGELYGDVVSIGNCFIYCSYINMSTGYADIDDSYVASISANEGVELIVNESVLRIGDSISDILSSIEKIGTATESQLSSEEYSEDECTNIVYEDSYNWRIEFNSAEENEIGIVSVKYTLTGDMNNGLKNIKYDLDIVTMESLYDVFDKLYL